jgi:RNA polymerase sigma-70 factor, ECF subfamily
MHAGEQTLREKFIGFYDEHYGKIHKHIYYRTGCNAAVADDLVAEAFLKAYEHLDSFRPNSSLKAWVYRIVHNHIIDYYRTHRVTVSYESLNDFASPERFTDIISDKHEVGRILKSLSDLPAKYQNAITLRYIDQLDTNEIAEVMNLSPNAVHVTLHRAIKKIQSSITV